MEIVAETHKENRRKCQEGMETKSETNIAPDNKITVFQTNDSQFQTNDIDGHIEQQNDEIHSDNEICGRTSSNDTYMQLEGLIEKENGFETMQTLQNEQLMILIETEILTRKESALNNSLIKLFEETFENLKEWNRDLRAREKSLMERYLERNKIVSSDIIPELNIGKVDLESEKHSDDGSVMTDDLMEEVEKSQLFEPPSLDSALYETENMLDATIQPDLHFEANEEDVEHDDDEQRDNSNNTIDNGRRAIKYTKKMNRSKFLTDGWTSDKIQRLYTQYSRAESFRQDLVYQKSYLKMIIDDPKLQFNNIPFRYRPSLKVGALVVLSIIRMKTLVKKYKNCVNIWSKKTRKRKPRSSKMKVYNTALKFSSDSENNESHVSSNSDGENDQLVMPIKSSLRNQTIDNTHTKRMLYYTDSIGSEDEVINETTLENNDGDDESALPNNVVSPPFISHGNTRRDGDVPKSYPRPSGAAGDANPSTCLNVSAVPLTKNSPRHMDDSAFPSTPLSLSPSTISGCSLIQHEFEDDDDLSFYMSTLDALQTKLKNVGFYKCPNS